VHSAHTKHPARPPRTICLRRLEPPVFREFVVLVRLSKLREARLKELALQPVLVGVHVVDEVDPVRRGVRIQPRVRTLGQVLLHRPSVQRSAVVVQIEFRRPRRVVCIAHVFVVCHAVPLRYNRHATTDVGLDEVVHVNVRVQLQLLTSVLKHGVLEQPRVGYVVCGVQSKRVHAHAAKVLKLVRQTVDVDGQVQVVPVLERLHPEPIP
jgi:hypothetical protein